MDICRGAWRRARAGGALMQEYNVGMSTLYDIRAHKAQLRRWPPALAGQSAGRSATSHTHPSWSTWTVLYEWFLVESGPSARLGPHAHRKGQGLLPEQMQLTEPSACFWRLALAL